MNRKKYIIRTIIISVILLIVQTITYLFFSQEQLKKKLLSSYFGQLAHKSDSAFVRDFYVTDCMSGDHWKYVSHNLKDDEAWLKEKLRVKYINFQSSDDFRWDNPTEEKYKLIYETFIQYGEPSTFFALYNAIQNEILIVEHKYLYVREVRYRWILFFWTTSFEYFELRDMSIK